MIELDERRHRIVREAAIGLIAQRLEFLTGERFADERRHHLGRGLGIAQAAQRANPVGRHRRPLLGQIQPAIGGEPGQRHPLEIEDGRISPGAYRSEEHTSELQSLMRISYAVFCLKKKKNHTEKTYIVYKMCRT